MGLVKIYKKDQLSKLSNAYGVSMQSTLNKRQMDDRLLEAIKSCPNERIPFPFSLAIVTLSQLQKQILVVLFSE